MAHLISVTPVQPVTASVSTSSDTRQTITEAVDIGECDWLDLELVVVSLSGPSTITIGLCTGMQLQTEDGWLCNTSLPSLNFFPIATGSQQRTFGPGLLRYVRWVVQPNATSGSVSFYVRGMARSR
jgi:hypothetical protein